MASQDYSFEGWLGKGPESVKGKMVWGKFPNPKPFDEGDVDIQITHCGICGSDLHTLRSGWGPTEYVSHPSVDKTKIRQRPNNIF